MLQSVNATTSWYRKSLPARWTTAATAAASPVSLCVRINVRARRSAGPVRSAAPTDVAIFATHPKLPCSIWSTREPATRVSVLMVVVIPEWPAFTVLIPRAAHWGRISGMGRHRRLTSGTRGWPAQQRSPWLTGRIMHLNEQTGILKRAINSLGCL